MVVRPLLEAVLCPNPHLGSRPKPNFDFAVQLGHHDPVGLTECDAPSVSADLYVIRTAALHFGAYSSSSGAQGHPYVGPGDRQPQASLPERPGFGSHAQLHEPWQGVEPLLVEVSHRQALDLNFPQPDRNHPVSCSQQGPRGLELLGHLLGPVEVED